MNENKDADDLLRDKLRRERWKVFAQHMPANDIPCNLTRENIKVGTVFSKLTPTMAYGNPADYILRIVHILSTFQHPPWTRRPVEDDDVDLHEIEVVTVIERDWNNTNLRPEIEAALARDIPRMENDEWIGYCGHGKNLNMLWSYTSFDDTDFQLIKEHDHLCWSIEKHDKEYVEFFDRYFRRVPNDCFPDWRIRERNMRKDRIFNYYTERVVNMAKAENYQPVQQLGLF